MSEPKTTMFVFAGNNGSGKSTIRNLIIDRIGISVNIDPDALARRINPLHPETARVSAGKEAIRLARDCIQNLRDFSIETTLSGGYAIRLMQEARAKNLDLVNDLLVVDNSALNGEIVLEADNGKLKYQDPKLPEWVLPIRSQLE